MTDLGCDGQTVRDNNLALTVRGSGTMFNPECRARADLIAQAPLEGLFRQHWKTRLMNSVIKRKFDDTIRSRKLSLTR